MLKVFLAFMASMALMFYLGEKFPSYAPVVSIGFFFTLYNLLFAYLKSLNTISPVKPNLL